MKKPARLVSLLVLVAGVSSLFGCGGGGIPPAPPSSGGSGISVTIVWPERGGQRLIPGPCDSVRVMLIDPGTGQVATQPSGYDFQRLIVKPASTAQFAGLPMGVSYNVVAVAYDRSDGIGICLATGWTASPVTTPTTPDTNAGASITMASVIDRVEVSPTWADLTVPPGSPSVPYQQQFTAAAWDDNTNPPVSPWTGWTPLDPWNFSPNYAPLTVPVGFNWSENSLGSVCGVDFTGLATAVTRSTTASAIVTATEQDTTIQGSATVNVGVSGYDVIVQ